MDLIAYIRKCEMVWVSYGLLAGGWSGKILGSVTDEAYLDVGIG